MTVRKMLKTKKFNLNHKKNQINTNNSEIFNNWRKFGLITKNEFIENLEWVCNDPLDDKERLTREIALVITPDMENYLKSQKKDGAEKFAMPYKSDNLKGKILKLNRIYDDKGSCAFYHDGKHYSGNGIRKICLSAEDRI